MARSRKLILKDWTKANDGLLLLYEGNKSKLADVQKMSRTTVTNFFNEVPVSEKYFRKICRALRLNWQEVSKFDTLPETLSSESPISPKCDELNLELIQEHCRQKIFSEHSQIRLLNGQEISVEQLYVDVWILKRLPQFLCISPSKFLESFDLRNDRLGLGDRIERNPGIEVAENKSKLMIIGKPGSGKSTFLKHLAIDWCNNRFQSELIAILIELRKIQNNDWNLVHEIDNQLPTKNWNEVCTLKSEISRSEEEIQNLKIKIELLKRQKYHREDDQEFDTNKEEERRKNIDKQIKDLSHTLELLPIRIETSRQRLEEVPLISLARDGNILILMDGLDEISNNSLRNKIQEQIKEFSSEFPENHIILTCRTQILKNKDALSGFSMVEIADFNRDQIRNFVINWFRASGNSLTEARAQFADINKVILSKPDLEELTRTPILLSLICWIFQDEGEIPTDRQWLYKKGVKLMLSQWNEKKQIDDWRLGSEKYHKLSVSSKESLMSSIASQKFENPKNYVLFEEEELADLITRHLKLDCLRDGVGVMRAIETQHGLLVERADGLWSFSHLTFQEYFAVRFLTQLPAKTLSQRIENHHWQKIIKQLVKSQQPADQLVIRIKHTADQFGTHSKSVEAMISYFFQRSNYTNGHFKYSAIRASLFALFIDFLRILESVSRCFLNKQLTIEKQLTIDLDFAYSIDSFFSECIERSLEAALLQSRSLRSAFDNIIILSNE